MAKSTSKKTTAKAPALTQDMSVSVRKIQNGFIVNTSGYTGKGKNQQYKSTEVFSKTNPVKINTGMKFGGK